MWYYFHWRSILVLSLPHPYFLSPQFPYKALTHRLFYKILKWWFQQLNILMWESGKKKNKKQNTTDKDLVFLHLQLLDSGVYFLATYILVSLSLSLVSNENSDIHLTGCYENWLRKHIWIYPPHCRGHTEDLHLFLWLSMHLGDRKNWHFDQ